MSGRGLTSICCTNLFISFLLWNSVYSTSNPESICEVVANGRDEEEMVVPLGWWECGHALIMI